MVGVKSMQSPFAQIVGPFYCPKVAAGSMRLRRIVDASMVLGEL